MNLITALLIFAGICLILFMIAKLVGHRAWKPSNFSVYTISKNNHYCNERIPVKVNSEFLTLQFKPDKSWYYSAKSDIHWNKLGGLTTNNIHDNSIRIAWRCTNEKIRIAIYEYWQGERIITPLGSVEGWESVIIELDKSKVLFRERFYPIKNHSQRGWLCFPYFGGTIPAPHDISFNLKYIYQ